MISLKILLEDMLAITTVIPFTLGTALLILVCGIFLGLLVALIRLFRVPVLNQIVFVYMQYTRGIPLIIHLYIAYYLLPRILNNITGNAPVGGADPMIVLIAAYSLYAAVGQSENIRGAFLSIEKGQWDAAYASGLTAAQTLRRVVFPQGLSLAIPAFFNQYLGIIKGLSLAFTIGVTDILARAKLASAVNFYYLEAYLSAALVYWGLCVALTFIFNKLELRFRKWE
ncbi:ABC transporter permease [Spirochaetia bacterium]|nr:ABC transporter permease [Spirochaetia bacterium]